MDFRGTFYNISHFLQNEKQLLEGRMKNSDYRTNAFPVFPNWCNICKFYAIAKSLISDKN